MNTNKLNEYLATGRISEPEVIAVEDAALLVVKAKAADADPLYMILANLCAVEMLAKDFHYRAKGKPFYGNHLLADLIGDMGESSDDLNEVYYMGELQQDPPFKCRVAETAVKIVDEIPAYANEDGYIEALFDVCNRLVGLVEVAKEKKQVKSGTTAILDKVSQDALQAVGFLKRVMTGVDMASAVDADVAVVDEALRKHADGSVCKAESPDACPFNKKAEAGERAISGQEHAKPQKMHPYVGETKLHSPSSVRGGWDVDSGAVDRLKGLKLSKPFNLTLSSAGGPSGEWTSVMNNKKEDGHTWLDPKAFSEFTDEDLEKIENSLTEWYEKERKMKDVKTQIDLKDGRITVMASR